MKKFVGLVVGFVLLFFPSMLWSVGPGDPPPASGWTITDPVADPVQSYDGNIGATGGAPSENLDYIAKVLTAPNAQRASQTGTTTSYQGSGKWACTIPEPNDSWDGFNGDSGVYTDMTLGIYYNSVQQVAVGLRCR